VVATGPVSVGAAWFGDVDEAVTDPAEAAVTVPVFAAGIVLARAAVVAPTPSTSVANDQFERRLTRRRPFSRGEGALRGPDIVERERGPRS